MDVVSSEIRSRMMSSIRWKDTKPEIIVRKHLHGLGFRFRLQKRIGKIRPDIVLPKWNNCIFVHGCYWHRHKGCSLASFPKSNTYFWETKFDTNVKRDRRSIIELEGKGWAIGIIWECTVRSGKFKNTDFKSVIGSKKSWIIG